MGMDGDENGRSSVPRTISESVPIVKLAFLPTLRVEWTGWSSDSLIGSANGSAKGLGSAGY
jgi:hypothetical protein